MALTHFDRDVQDLRATVYEWSLFFILNFMPAMSYWAFAKRTIKDICRIPLEVAKNICKKKKRNLLVVIDRLAFSRCHILVIPGYIKSCIFKYQFFNNKRDNYNLSFHLIS